jgi:hypothetical protein
LKAATNHADGQPVIGYAQVSRRESASIRSSSPFSVSPWVHSLSGVRSKPERFRHLRQGSNSQEHGHAFVALGHNLHFARRCGESILDVGPVEIFQRPMSAVAFIVPEGVNRAEK